MPYRAKNEAPSGTGNLVTVRQYLDPVQAQLARTRLDAHGIEAHVFEAASYNPALSGAAGGARLQVREGDLERAAALVEEHPGDGGLDEGDDGEGEAAVRCPRCELTYCFHERMRLEGRSGATALAFFAAPLMLFLPKRWHCHKCGHVWDDPREGPTRMTVLGADDPRPVFRLRRSHAGAGLFAGLVAGFLAMNVAIALLPRGLKEMGVFFFFGVLAAGIVLGRAWRYDLCSQPLCRTPLPAGQEDCPRCNGEIAGVVRSAEAHYAAAADFRRELRAQLARDAARRPPKKKKKKKPSALPPSV